MLGGYANKIGFVNLSAGEVEYKDAPEDWKRKYIGGSGLGVKYVFENGVDVDPLSPDNILCFMNGPLTGSEANMSGRMGETDAYAVAMVPWTQFYENDFALHTSYWHDGFGYRQSHGCVNLSIMDSWWLFEFTNPEDHTDAWVYVYSSGTFDNG